MKSRAPLGLVLVGALCAPIVSTGALTVRRWQNVGPSGGLQRYSPSADPATKTSTLLHNQLTPWDKSDDSCWNPKLRRAMGTIAGLGVMETAYLTLTKLTQNNLPLLCGSVDPTESGSSCSSVLDGPYAFIPGTDIPLSLLGFIAYSTVALLAIVPLFGSSPSSDGETNENSEDLNRLLLTASTTTMGIFSIFLMIFLFGALKESCVYCVTSAIFSVTLAKLAWLGGAVPSNRMKEGIQWSATSGGLASLLASILIASATSGVDSSVLAESGNTASNGSSAGVLMASAETKKDPQNTPPPILNSSSPRALEISRDLQTLNARMFGAYWCSHCYDQKERLGKEAMSEIPYIECSREGYQSQAGLCRKRDVPGYPTWEINGNLYPGEMELDELEKIIRDSKSTQS